MSEETPTPPITSHEGDLIEIIEIPGADRDPGRPLPPPPSPEDFVAAHAAYMERLTAFKGER